jgi:hypothetical protein
MGEDLYRDDVQCDVRRLEYDFETRTGILHLGSGSCTDMSGCIKLFKGIDPEVLAIHTLSLPFDRADPPLENRKDTSYIRKKGSSAWYSVRRLS